MSSSRRLLVGLSIACALVGCNAILDNRVGIEDDDPRTETDETSPSAPAESPPEDAAAAADGGERDAAQCPGGMKWCAGACVSTEDPHFGCGAEGCGSCDLAHASAECASGACAVAACYAGRGDCNGDPGDGCEEDLTSITSCGACGVVCEGGEGGTPACVDGACALACEPGLADCNADPADGCEADLERDRANCGECGRVCIFGRCRDGACRL